MHVITGDGKLADAGTGKDVFADQNLPARDATQLTHEFANALMFEIIHVIESEGINLNASTETFGQMNQLLEAIDKKVSGEATLRSDADDNLQGQVSSNAATISINASSISGIDAFIAQLKGLDVNNDSSVAGTTVKDALETLAGAIIASNASDINNDSSVGGSTVKDALQTLDAARNNLTADNIANDSGVDGASVKNAFDSLKASNISDDSTIGAGEVSDALNFLVGALDDRAVMDLEVVSDMQDIGLTTVNNNDVAINQVNVNNGGNTSFGWNNLNMDDKVLVSKRFGTGSFDGSNVEYQTALSGRVVNPTTIEFSAANSSAQQWNPGTADAIIITIIRKKV